MPSEQNKKIKKGKEILKQQQNYFTHLEMITVKTLILLSFLDF